MPERARKPSEQAGDTAASRGRPAPAPAALALQRLAGNRAVTSLVQASRDQHREEEADTAAAVAGATMGEEAANRAAAGLAGPGPRHLPPSMQAALRPVVGDTTDVTVDAGPGSAQATDAIGARAFADGSSVHLHPAERSATDAGGLVLHEAAHAALHAPAPGLVHAKLRGTRAAVESQGGGTSSGKGRQLLSRLKGLGSKALTKWDQILAALTAYEQAELGLEVGGMGKISPRTALEARPRLLALLSAVDTAAAAWLAANGGEAGNAAKVKHQIVDRDLPTERMADVDVRTKTARRQAVNMLTVRLTSEREQIVTGRWTAGLGLTDAKRTGGKDAEDSGMMNVVDRVIYDIGTGTPFEGFFKADKGFEDSAPGHQQHAGISNSDPNYGGRSVAMHRLDQLLETGVIARSEFAVHNNKMGNVTEKAGGTAANKIQLAITDSERARRGGDTVSAEDPVLQRCLNKLQVIDAIAGQLDRHAGNYYIQTDGAGKVTGVTGIDLDMAFGQNQQDASIGAKHAGAKHYRGIPALIDYELGERLIRLTDEDVERAITGLLSPQEVAATKARFAQVRQHALVLKRSNQLTSTWDANTAKSQRPTQPTTMFNFGSLTSYLDALTDDASEDTNLAKPCRQVVSAIYLDWKLAQLDAGEPPETVSAIVAALEAQVAPLVTREAYAGGIGIDQAAKVAGLITMQLLGDHSFENTLHVASQDQGDLGPLVLAKAQQLLNAIKAQGIPSLVGG